MILTDSVIGILKTGNTVWKRNLCSDSMTHQNKEYLLVYTCALIHLQLVSESNTVWCSCVFV